MLYICQLFKFKEFMLKFFVVFLCFISYWQSQAQTVCSDLSLITVNGTGVVNALPNQAIVVVRVEKQIPLSSISAGKETFLFSKEDLDIKYVDSRNVLNSLTEVEVKSNVSIFIKHFVITLDDVTLLPKLYVDLINKNFFQIESIQFRVSNITILNEQATVLALDQAKLKAEQYARHIGQSLGDVHKIVELKSESVNWYEVKDKADIATMISTEYVLNPATITVVTNLQVSYDLMSK